jgi:hypothetical protein
MADKLRTLLQDQESVQQQQQSILIDSIISGKKSFI